MARPSRSEPQQRRSSAIVRLLLVGAVGATAFAAAAAGAFVALTLRKTPLTPRISENELEFFRNDDLRAAQLDRSLNILVLGTDNPDPSESNNETSLQGRSDTVLLVRFDPEAETIRVLSIPRDTRVRIPDRGINKINAANAIGGPALTAQVVSQLLGDVPIDRYVRLSTDGIVELVDVLGGVTIDVPTRMRYVDRTQGLEIDLEPGLQHLNGDRAHQFIRFRQDELGDIGRVQRQQLMMRALSQQALSPMTITRLPQILNTISDHVDTNMTLEELLALSTFVLRSEGDRLDMVMLPGRFSRTDESPISFWIIDSQNTYRVAVSFFGAEAILGETLPSTPAQQRVAVTNASGLPRMGRNMANTLREWGFTNIYVIADSPQTLAKTEIIAQQGDAMAASGVRDFLGLGQVQIESTGEITSDITVRVGQDWATQYLEQLEQTQAAIE